MYSPQIYKMQVRRILGNFLWSRVLLLMSLWKIPVWKLVLIVCYGPIYIAISPVFDQNKFLNCLKPFLREIFKIFSTGTVLVSFVWALSPFSVHKNTKWKLAKARRNHWILWISVEPSKNQSLYESWRIRFAFSGKHLRNWCKRNTDV